MSTWTLSSWGESAFICAFVISCLQALVTPKLMRASPTGTLTLLRGTALFQGLLVTLAFASLIHAYVSADFSLKNVFENSHSHTPLFYKITGVWGNHEGSMLLWAWLFCLYGLGFAFMKAPPTTRPFRARVLWVQGILTLLNLGYVLFLSSPFKRLSTSLSQGMDLNPLLQDVSLAIHPPMLYTGYVGFCLVFACAVAGSKNPENASLWQASARRWCLWSWSFLTIGITLGSWWAYYELGWGGWWFWDPVENASLMPWLCATALLHLWPTTKSAPSQEPARLSLRLLSVLTFSFCLLGLCLVRSGVLSTVHAFAKDPERGAYLGLMTFVVALWGLTSVVQRTPSQREESWGWDQPSSIRIQTLLFSTLVFTLCVATLYPLLLETFFDISITVGPPYFTKTFVPIAFVGLILMGAAPLLPLSKGLSFQQVRARLATPFLLSLLLGCVLLYAWDTFVWRAVMGVCCAGWIVATTLKHWWHKKGPALSRHGMALAHLGIAGLIWGMCVQTYGQKEHLVALKVGEKTTFAGKTFTLKKVGPRDGPTYQAERAELLIEPGNALMGPEKRFYPSREVLTSETALYPQGMSLFYAALGGLLPQDRWTLRLYYHPQVIWIWLGAIMAAMGAGLCLLARRKKGDSL